MVWKKPYRKKIESVINKYFIRKEEPFTYYRQHLNFPYHPKCFIENSEKMFLYEVSSRYECRGTEYLLNMPIKQTGTFTYNDKLLKGKFFFKDGQQTFESDKVTFKDFRPRPNLENATDLRFLELLIGTNNLGCTSSYTAAIVLELLNNIDNNNVWKKERNALKNCIEHNKKDSYLEAIQDITDFIENKDLTDSKLVFLNSLGHSMGLSISKEDNEMYTLHVYNSGEGLECHDSYLSRKLPFFPRCIIEFLSLFIKNKYETKKTYKFNKEKLIEVVKKITEATDKNAHELYKIIEEKSESVVKQDAPCLQTCQKSGNCTLEWIFAYLKNSNPEKYTQLRKEIFLYCQNKLETKINSLESNSPYKERYQKIIAELDRKIKKREKKQQNVFID